MFQSNNKDMPARDYVSIVSSFYKEKVALAIGALVSASAVISVYLHTGVGYMPIFAALFLISGALRHLMIVRFEKAKIAEDDIVAAARWEAWATVATVGTALIYGVWSFVCIAIVKDPYAQLASSMVSVAVLIGLTSRSFAIDRLVTLSSSAIAVPLAAGLILVGNPYYVALGILLMPYLFSLRSLAAGIRKILMRAVHDRQKAAKLAAELDMALSTMPHGLCMVDDTGKICVINDQVSSSFIDKSNQSSMGRSFAEVISDAREAGTLTGATADYLESEVAHGGKSKLVVGLPDGRQCEVTINTKRGHTVLVTEDITERVQSAERINYMARYDGLTHLINRSYFSEQVAARLNELQAAGSDETVMMMIVDIDDFKHVNDTLGHQAGDTLLVEVAKRISQIAGSDCLVARFGGDEFTIFKMGEVSEEAAQISAEKLLKALQEPAWIQNELVPMKASIGVTVNDGSDCALEDLLRRADLALYDAKAKGRNRASSFHPEMDVEYRLKQRLRSDLVDALSNDELYLLFQPIVDIKERRITGCEALIRWRHKQLGLIPPLQFITIAEEIGVMADITRWVLEQGCAACAAWPDPMTISVNLSATDFCNADIEEMIGNALDKSGLAPERLVVEVTETAIIEDLESAEKSLACVREKGVGVALDDFGTGYSSLSYLHSLPFTRLKIDRSFVVDVTTNKRAQRLLSNIAQLSADLELSVTVEGIETEEQMQILSETPNISLVQGYLFGAPLPYEDVSEIIARVLPSKKMARGRRKKAKAS